MKGILDKPWKGTEYITLALCPEVLGSSLNLWRFNHLSDLLPCFSSYIYANSHIFRTFKFITNTIFILSLHYYVCSSWNPLEIQTDPPHRLTSMNVVSFVYGKFTRFLHTKSKENDTFKGSYGKVIFLLQPSDLPEKQYLFPPPFLFWWRPIL